MDTLQEKTVADFVTANIKTADVFKKHGIDFCCGGGITLSKACDKYNADFDSLINDLMAINENPNKAYDYNSWDLEFLIDHIVNVHHSYVEENIPLLLQYAQRVAQVHGTHYEEVVTIHRLATEVANELTTHMKKEEIILFPFIKKMIKASKKGESLTPPAFGTVNNPIAMMEEEHETAGELLRQIANLSNNYTPPQGACNTFKALYAKLDEFEQDLHQHVHLENNILFPKAKQLEKTIAS